MLQHITLLNLLFIHFNVQADQVVQEMERNCEQKLAELKEESRQCLIRIQEEHATLVCVWKEWSLSSYDQDIHIWHGPLD